MSTVKAFKSEQKLTLHTNYEEESNISFIK